MTQAKIPAQLIALAERERRRREALGLRQDISPADIAYRSDPLGWMYDRLAIPKPSIDWASLPEFAAHRWDGVPNPLVVAAEALADGKDVGIESATGTGKTYFAAAIALWFCACFPDALIITTAPKEDQLTTQLWKEIGRHWPAYTKHYPQASMVTLRLRMREGAGEQERWAVIGYACGVGSAEEAAARAQGFHAAHMLIITEETPGINPAVMAAFLNTSVGSHNLRLALGNPDNVQDPLHQFCMEKAVVHVRISAFDHPNVVLGRDVIPGAQTQKGIEKLADKWGVDTPMYMSRVRGISPRQALDALIKYDWCEQAGRRLSDATWTKGRVGPRAMGVDVAQSENGDKAAIARGQGAVLESVTDFACANATQLGRDVAEEARRHGIPAQFVAVDPIGVGAAAVNELRERLGFSVRALNGSDSPIEGGQRAVDGSLTTWIPDANEHRNLRGQMWWQLREDLRLGSVALPWNEALFKELTAIRWESRNGVVWIESKIETRKRLGHSPNLADAVVYWNWVRPREVTVEEQQAFQQVKEKDRALAFDYKNRKKKGYSTEEAIEKELQRGTARTRAPRTMFYNPRRPK